MNHGSAAKQAYDKAYEATPEQKKNRAARNKARADFEKAHGDLPSTKDVDHKKMLDNGGSNDASNTRAISVKDNRGWRKDHPKTYGK